MVVDFITKWGPVLVLVIGSASVLAAVIAPLTKNEWDNKLAKGLKWLKLALDKLALNPSTPK